MAAKNAEEWIADCLQSIVEQTEQNWELLVVDDYSNDRTARIIQEYVKEDSRIHYLLNEADGIIPALQMAYAHSKGNFIHRMDADDLMPSNKLKLLKQRLVEVGKGNLITAKVKYFSAEGLSDGYLQYEKWLNELCDQNNHWDELFKECVIPSPCWMVYRSDFETCGGFNSAIYPEDYDLVFRFYRSGLKVVSCPEVLHLWRDHAQRSSRTQEHYKNNNFFAIKLHYFIQLKYNAERPLVLWGAGNNGKTLAKQLQSAGLPFTWVSNNPNKHGKEIYDQLMESFENIVTKNSPQVLITVAQRNAKKEIRAFLKKQKLNEGNDYFFLR